MSTAGRPQTSASASSSGGRRTQRKRPSSLWITIVVARRVGGCPSACAGCPQPRPRIASGFADDLAARGARSKSESSVTNSEASSTAARPPSSARLESTSRRATPSVRRAKRGRTQRQLPGIDEITAVGLLSEATNLFAHDLHDPEGQPVRGDGPRRVEPLSTGGRAQLQRVIERVDIARGPRRRAWRGDGRSP